jgi:hypothetical protein
MVIVMTEMVAIIHNFRLKSPQCSEGWICLSLGGMGKGENLLWCEADAAFERLWVFEPEMMDTPKF